MSDQEEPFQPRPQRKSIRTPGTAQHDQAMAEQKARDAQKMRKKNIDSQREAMKAASNAQASPRLPGFEILLPATPHYRRAKQPAGDSDPRASPAPSAASDDTPHDPDSDAAPHRSSKSKTRVAPPTRSKPPAQTRPSTTNKGASRSKGNGGSQSKPRAPSPFGLEAATPPPESSPKKVPSRSKGKGGSQPKPRANTHSRFEAAAPPPESAPDAEDSGRFKNETEAETLRRLKLVAAISERDHRCDHTKYDYETLKMIWSVKPKATTASSNPDLSAQAGRRTGINALGSMELDDIASQKSSSRASKSARDPSENCSSGPRHSTPVTTGRVAASRVASAGYRPSPVQSGMIARFRSTSAMSSRSSSPYALSDRDLASDFDASIADEMESTAELTEPSTGKPRLSDYQGTYREIIDATFTAACAHLVTEGFFPGRQALDDIINTCWKTAARQIGVDPTSARYCITKNPRTLTHHRIHSYQGRLKDKIVKALQDGYDLGKDKDTIKERADALLPHGFYTKPGSPPGKGLYQHPYIGKAINNAFFSAKQRGTPIGVSHAGMFGGDDGMPLHTVALVCAIIEWGLKQHKAGADISAMMQGKAVEKIYDSHLRTLVQFESINGELADIMRQQWYISASKHSKTAVSSSANQAGLPPASSMPLILPEKPSKKAQLAVKGALKRSSRGMIRAPPAADESGGFDDVSGSDDSNPDKAFTTDESPRKTDSPHKSHGDFHDEDAPPPRRTAKPKPVWTSPRHAPSHDREDGRVDRMGPDRVEEREEEEDAGDRGKEPGSGKAKGVAVGKGVGKGVDGGKGTGAGKGTSVGKGMGGGQGRRDEDEEMEPEEEEKDAEKDAEEREFEEEVRREVERRRAERKRLAGLAQRSAISTSKTETTPPARRNGNSKPPGGGSHRRTPSTSRRASVSRKRDFNDVDGDFDGDREEDETRRKRAHKG